MKRVLEGIYESGVFKPLESINRATLQAKAGNEVSGTHPEIRSYLEDVRSAIESPDLVFQST
jgi:predicted DNA-binding antitoxin AbrB/MazE fold protein